MMKAVVVAVVMMMGTVTSTMSLTFLEKIQLIGGCTGLGFK